MTDDTAVVLAVRVDGTQYLIGDDDTCEDVQVMLLLKSQRAAERGDDDERDYFEFLAGQVGCLFTALQKGLMLPQPPMEI